MKLLRAVLALLVIAAGLIGLGPSPGSADPPGITSSLLLDGNEYDGVEVIESGQTLAFSVFYTFEVGAGTTVDFDFGPNVAVTDVPGGNDAIESITQNGNVISVKFEDEWPSGISQGVFEFELTVEEVEHSTKEPITWTVDGESNSIEVIIRKPGDEFANVSDGAAKQVNPTNLDRFVEVDGDQVTLDPGIADQTLTYRLQLSSPEARTGFEITDQLPAGLSYVNDSFSATLTRWDENGLNKETAPFSFAPTISGGSFSGDVDVPGPSVLDISYQVTVTDIAALETQLQAAMDDRGGNPGNFQIDLTNTAAFGGEDTTRTANVRLRGNIAGPGLGTAFRKSALDPIEFEVAVDEDGTVRERATATYRLQVDNSIFDDRNDHFRLDRNVVIQDQLPDEAAFATDDPDFLTVGNWPGHDDLTEAADCPSVADFADDQYVGQWCVTDAGRLIINVGKDNTLDQPIRIDVRVDLLTVDGLEIQGSTSVTDSVKYRLRNTADFHYREGGAYRRTADVFPFVLPDGDDGFNDETVFSKNSHLDGGQAVVQPGETITVDYTFRLASGTGIDITKSRIVDHLDREFFDPSDPNTIDLSGSYDGQALDADDFITSENDDGDLVIELSASGEAVVADRGDDKEWLVHISLTTRPFDGKETMTIVNRATLIGEDEQPLYWSETTEESTSYGDEAEIAKHVWDAETGAWEKQIDAHMDGEGNLAEPTQYYRLRFIPHGKFDNVTISPVMDFLPGSVEFVGFVDDTDDPVGGSISDGPIDIGGNLEAVHDGASGTVTIRQQDGTRLDAAGGPFDAVFAVDVTDASESIVNSVEGTEAIIDPVPSVSVGDFVWFDVDRDGLQGDDEPGISGVTLCLVGPDGEPVVDVFGDPVEPTVTDADGWYTFENLPVIGEGESYTVCIDREASEEALRPYVPTLEEEGDDRAVDSSTWESSSVLPLTEDGDRDPTLDFGFVLKTYAIGDYVWIDVDRDGIQGPDEPVLEGVSVELLDEDGAVIDTTTTDSEGRYLFDELEAGTYRVRFVLTEEQAAIYEFTQDLAGDDVEVDSDADRVTGESGRIVLGDDNEFLTLDYDREFEASEGIDPTWDAGVVEVDQPDDPVDEPEDPGTGEGDVDQTGPSQPSRVGPLPLTGAAVTNTVLIGLVALAAGFGLRRLGRIAGSSR